MVYCELQEKVQFDHFSISNMRKTQAVMRLRQMGSINL